MPAGVQGTRNPLDVALQGEGFFQVNMPDGSTGYTRDGSFGVDANGTLITSGGLSVQANSGSSLAPPPDSIDAHFDNTGQLVATDPTGVEQVIGRLGLAQFANSPGLRASGHNLWTP